MLYTPRGCLKVRVRNRLGLWALNCIIHGEVKTAFSSWQWAVHCRASLPPLPHSDYFPRSRKIFPLPAPSPSGASGKPVSSLADLPVILKLWTVFCVRTCFHNYSYSIQKSCFRDSYLGEKRIKFCFYVVCFLQWTCTFIKISKIITWYMVRLITSHYIHFLTCFIATLVRDQLLSPYCRWENRFME